LVQSVALYAQGDVDRAFEHPHLLVHAQVARTGSLSIMMESASTHRTVNRRAARGAAALNG
jgi:hypothetical protein